VLTPFNHPSLDDTDSVSQPVVPAPSTPQYDPNSPSLVSLQSRSRSVEISKAETTDDEKPLISSVIPMGQFPMLDGELKIDSGKKNFSRKTARERDDEYDMIQLTAVPSSKTFSASVPTIDTLMGNQLDSLRN
jgi:hypothetical protein